MSTLLHRCWWRQSLLSSQNRNFLGCFTDKLDLSVKRLLSEYHAVSKSRSTFAHLALECRQIPVSQTVCLHDEGELGMLRSIRTILALLLLASVLALLPGAHVGAQDATPGGPRATGPFSGPVDIGGRSLWLECMGEGSPTVILESGSPFMMNTDWYSVQAGIAEVTHVCAYDRANVGSSDPAPQPRSVQQMADDLDALLTAAGVPGPYVLAPTSGPWVTGSTPATIPSRSPGWCSSTPYPWS